MKKEAVTRHTLLVQSSINGINMHCIIDNIDYVTYMDSWTGLWTTRYVVYIIYDCMHGLVQNMLRSLYYL